MWTTYRVYVISNDGRIADVPHLIEAKSDEEARAKAGQFVDGHDVELWDGPRLVVRLSKPR
jgi:hypothetical protein